MASEELEAKWQRNEAELNRIHAAPPLDREMLARREEELLSEQDRIEFELGARCGEGLHTQFETFRRSPLAQQTIAASDESNG